MPNIMLHTHAATQRLRPGSRAAKPRSTGWRSGLLLAAWNASDNDAGGQGATAGRRRCAAIPHVSVRAAHRLRHAKRWR